MPKRFLGPFCQGKFLGRTTINLNLETGRCYRFHFAWPLSWQPHAKPAHSGPTSGIDGGEKFPCAWLRFDCNRDKWKGLTYKRVLLFSKYLSPIRRQTLLYPCEQRRRQPVLGLLVLNRMNYPTSLSFSYAPDDRKQKLLLLRGIRSHNSRASFLPSKKMSSH